MQEERKKVQMIIEALPNRTLKKKDGGAGETATEKPR